MRLKEDWKKSLKMFTSNFKFDIQGLTNPYRKIKENKQHTINEGKKVNDSLKRFQDKFT